MAKSVFIFVPTFGQQLTTTTFLTTHKVIAAFASKGVAGGISALSFPDIAELRNIALTLWYDTLLTSTHLFFIDSDMGFEPELPLDMLTFDEPVVGAICPQRVLPIKWAGTGVSPEDTEVRGGFMKVAGIGMACTMIRRDAISTMLERMPEINDLRVHNHPINDIAQGANVSRIIRAFDKIDLPEQGPLSEDLSFCRRWTQCGGEVWAAINHRISHVGPYAYGAHVSYSEHVAQKQAQAAE